MRGYRCNVCGKRRYASEEYAKRAAWMLTIGEENRQMLEVYPAHGWWHIRNSEKRKAVERRKRAEKRRNHGREGEGTAGA